MEAAEIKNADCTQSMHHPDTGHLVPHLTTELLKHTEGSVGGRGRRTSGFECTLWCWQRGQVTSLGGLDAYAIEGFSLVRVLELAAACARLCPLEIRVTAMHLLAQGDSARVKQKGNNGGLHKTFMASTPSFRCVCCQGLSCLCGNSLVKQHKLFTFG